MQRKILVIGATGLLGEPVARRLQQEGYLVRLMVRDVERALGRFGNSFEIVKGDIFDNESLEKSMDGCSCVHINLSGGIEQVGVEKIAATATKLKLQRITYISGTSVSEKNVWIPLIKRKFFAEKAIFNSGITYTVFCPTWFMEILPKYVRGKRAFVFGRQPNAYHFIAAEDYARMVATSYGLEETANKRFIIHGPEGLLFHDAVERYCKTFHPDIKNVTTMPYWLATVIAAVKGTKELKWVSDFMAAFEKIGELGDPTEANSLLGKPKITLQEWLQDRKDPKAKNPTS